MDRQITSFSNREDLVKIEEDDEDDDEEDDDEDSVGSLSKLITKKKAEKAKWTHEEVFYNLVEIGMLLVDIPHRSTILPQISFSKLISG